MNSGTDLEKRGENRGQTTCFLISAFAEIRKQVVWPRFSPLFSRSVPQTPVPLCHFSRGLMQRERSALRIFQLSNTAAAGHVHWPVHHGGAALLRTLQCGIKVGC